MTYAYNGILRFAPDVVYEIKENGDDITVLRNGEPVGGGGDMGGIVRVNCTYGDGYLGEFSYDDLLQIIEDGKVAYTVVDITDDKKVIAWLTQLLFAYGTYQADFTAGTMKMEFMAGTSSANMNYNP